MKKLKFVFPLLFCCSLAFSQHNVSGAIKKDHRKALTNKSDTIFGNINAQYVIQFSVNSDGKVTSTKVLKETTKEISSVARIQAENYVRTFRFQKGVRFPKYHQGKITIYMVTGK